MGESMFHSRKIKKRLIVEGSLKLKSPANFGGGEDEAIDMSLALDAKEGIPVIWGTSLAGALRSYTIERLYGYPDGSEAYEKKVEDPKNAVNRTFGFQKGENGSESCLIISDALSQNADIEYRDLVDIDRKTRTAVDEHKYDAELIAAGTEFPIKFELLITEAEDNPEKNNLEEILAIALHGLEQGEISLGAKKSRGWGSCRVSEWKVRSYDLSTPPGLAGWLDDAHEGFEQSGGSIEDLLNVRVKEIDRRDVCTICVDLHLASPMMIASISDNPNDPDAAHLSRRSPSRNKNELVVSGTGLAGVLRSQSSVILKTLGYADETLDEFENGLWGYVEIKGENSSASRVQVKESALENVFSRVQSRIRINHFTGGTYQGALFNEMIVLPEDDNMRNFTLMLEVRNPSEAEIGLLLLAIKDLCLGNISIGGGNGIGRGYLEGKKITLDWTSKKMNVEIIQREDNHLEIGNEALISDLEDFVHALKLEG